MRPAQTKPRPFRLRLALIGFGACAAILLLHAWYYRRFMGDRPDTVTIVLETRGSSGAHVRSVTLDR